jgi:Family of unknown function (DUF6318)
VRITVAVVAVALVVAGCSGSDPEPSPIPVVTTTGSSPTESPTPSPTPTVVAPTLPAAARADTPAGAEAFARYWMTALDHASRSGETAALRALGTCQTCVAQANGIDSFFASGGTVNGGVIKVKSANVIRFVATAALVNVTYGQSAGRTTTGTGNTQEVPAVAAATFAFTLSRSAAGWSVEKLQTVE